MISRYPDLHQWLREVSDERDRSRTAIKALEDRLVYLTNLISHIESLIDFAKQEPTLPLPLLNGHTQNDANTETGSVILDENGGRKRTFITKRWLEHCRDYLATAERATVDELLSRAPLDIQEDLEKSGPPGSVLFRARRMLRRDHQQRFAVDRNTGEVTLTVKKAKPTQAKVLPPPLPPPPVQQKIVNGPVPTVLPKGGQDVLVLTKVHEDNGRVFFDGHIPQNHTATLTFSFEELLTRIKTVNDVWVKVGENGFEPVGYRVDSDQRTRIGSYLNGVWTGSLRNLIVKRA